MLADQIVGSNKWSNDILLLFAFIILLKNGLKIRKFGKILDGTEEHFISYFFSLISFLLF